MRNTFFIILVSTFQVFANGSYAQTKTISLTMNNATIREVLYAIQNQSEFYFLYNSELVDVEKKVNIAIEGEKVDEILTRLFDKKDVDFLIKDRYIVLTPVGGNAELLFSQQQRSVSGKVTDSGGQPLPGVTVVVKGTTQGTVTNSDGDYSLSNIPEDATLVFSFVGMHTHEVVVGTQTRIDTQMEEETIGLEEVVAIGYGTQRVGEITGSVSNVNTEHLASIPASQVSAALKGQLSGVTITSSHKPGDNAVIRIRGLGTINNNDPLWVVDGVPGAPVPIEEIESISVLKDASSQAIYGSRAANGVILVTTKSGKSGQKARIRASFKTGMSQNTKSFELLNTPEYGEYLWLRAKNSGIQNYSHAIFGNGPTPDIPEYIFPARAQNVDHSLYDNLMIHEDGTDTYLITKANKEGTDWLSEITRNAPYHQYGIEISGGSDDTNYAFIGNYLNQDGILKHTGFERYNLRSNVATKITNWLKIGERLAASISTNEGNRSDHAEGGVMSFSYRMPPIIPVYDVMGNFAGSRPPEMGNAKSPAFILYSNRNNYNKRLDVNGNFYLNATFLKDFTFQSLFGFLLNSSSNKSFSFNEVATSERGTYDGLSQSESNIQQWNWTNTLQYKKSINQHSFDIIAGTEAVANEYKIISASRTEFFAKTPNYMQLNVGQRDITNSGNMSEWSLFSQFGRLNYNFAHKYYFQATIRRDGSSRFGQENRYGIFPALSAGWGISEEEFMQQTKNWLDNLRLRFGWGTTGNDQIGNYNGYTTFASSPTASYYPISGSQTSATAGFYANAIGNPDAKWETTTTTNIGVDVVMFRNFILNVDLWKRITDDMLYNKKIPNVLGAAAAPAVNIGSMENYGIDLNLGYQGKMMANELFYDVSLNISHYKNKITSLSDRADEFISGEAQRNHIYTRAETGKEFPYFYGFIVDGIFQNEDEVNSHPNAFGETGTYNKPGRFKFRDVNGDKVINDEDRTYIGSPHPDFTAGLNLNFEYRNFTLSTFLYSSYGNDVINVPRRYIDFNAFTGNRSKRALYESWGSPYLADNSEATMPMVDLDDAGSQNPSSYFVEDGSYLRLENLMIGYNFRNLFESQNKIHIYTQITNLFTVTNYSGLDPEIGRGGINAGVDYGAWPTPRQYIFGINFEF